MTTPTTRSLAHRPSGGLYIGFDGPDGVGKGTVLNIVEAALRARFACPVLRVREPGGTPLGESIRDILLKRDGQPMDGHTALFLFSALRRTLVTEVVAPALESGAIVLSDRTVVSSIVYQGAQGVPAETIRAISDVALEAYWPDRTLILTASAETTASRRGGRGTAADQFERLAADDSIRVRYESATGVIPNGLLLSAEGTPEEVASRVLDALAPDLAPLPQRPITRRAPIRA